MATTVRVLCTCPASTSSPLVAAGDHRQALPKRTRHPQRSRVRMNATRSFPVAPPRDVRAALLLALTSQAAMQSQRALQSLAQEAAKYVNARRGDARNLEEALMTVPDLETIPYKVVRKEGGYEIREVQSYLIAETELPGRSAFDFVGSGQGFNTLAEYLFGKNTKREAMEMTTPVVVQRGGSQGEKMEMTTPVLSQGSDQDGWRMGFVLPSKYNEENVPAPDNSAVKITRVPMKTLAVTAFSGFVTDDIVKRKELKLRQALKSDPTVKVKVAAQPEVAQYNPPFTPPFARRNEIALEVEVVSSE
ncbi:unnamed protein product [Calypogeia fissa]